jgi:hypothetical protein
MSKSTHYPLHPDQFGAHYGKPKRTHVPADVSRSINLSLINSSNLEHVPEHSILYPDQFGVHYSHPEQLQVPAETLWVRQPVPDQLEYVPEYSPHYPYQFDVYHVVISLSFLSLISKSFSRYLFKSIYSTFPKFGCATLFLVSEAAPFRNVICRSVFLTDKKSYKFLRIGRIAQFCGTSIPSETRQKEMFLKVFGFMYLKRLKRLTP